MSTGECATGGAAASGATRRWWLLGILTTAYGAGAFGVLGLSPLSPSLVDGFALSRLDVAFIVPSVYLGGLLFSLPAGRLADRIGVRPTLLGGLALGALGLLAAALAPAFSLFLVFLFVAGTGWSVVNPALGKAIMDAFPVRERGIAMGIKQMGLTLGGVASALALPSIAAAFDWRTAVATCAIVVAVPVVATWRTLGALVAETARATPSAHDALGDHAARWSWLRRPALLVLFACGIALGMVQAAVLSYLPLYTIQALGFDKVGAGFLVACSQAGGAISRLALGAASDRWLVGHRSAWLALTAALGAAIFVLYAVSSLSAPAVAGTLAFLAGVGAFGWVGIYFVISAEAGGLRQAGLLSGVAFASIVIGLLVGPSVFGLLLDTSNSYRVPWAAFATLSILLTVALLWGGPRIDAERRGSP